MAAIKTRQLILIILSYHKKTRLQETCGGDLHRPGSVNYSE